MHFHICHDWIDCFGISRIHVSKEYPNAKFGMTLASDMAWLLIFRSVFKCFNWSCRFAARKVNKVIVRSADSNNFEVYVNGFTVSMSPDTSSPPNPYFFQPKPESAHPCRRPPCRPGVISLAAAQWLEMVSGMARDNFGIFAYFGCQSVGNRWNVLKWEEKYFVTH